MSVCLSVVCLSVDVLLSMVKYLPNHIGINVIKVFTQSCCNESVRCNMNVYTFNGHLTVGTLFSC